MPDGGRGWYTNAVEGDAYEDDLIKDVIGLVERTFPVKAERAGRAIGGLSMGGYGAVKLGLKHPELFASVNSHSGALGFLRGDPEAVQGASTPSSTGSSASRPPDGPEDPFAIVETDRPRPRPRAADRLRHRGLLARPEPGLPRPPGIAAHPARVPGVSRHPQLGLLGPAHPGGHRIPRPELADDGASEDPDGSVQEAAVLRELSVQNLALIEDVQVELEAGYCAWTGETGAGKSLLLTALGWSWAARRRPTWSARARRRRARPRSSRSTTPASGRRSRRSWAATAARRGLS